MTDTPHIVPGSRVSMHYRVFLEDGTQADSSYEDEPLRFVMGDGSVVPGLEVALLGLRRGDTQSLEVDPAVGFGDHDPQHVQSMPRSDFPSEMDLQEGLIIGFALPSGEEVPGAIVGLEGESVVVDFNHPLAGRRIRFAVEILDVEDPSSTSAE